MNILFVLKTMEIGGVEVVTSVLANKFSSEGHRVVVFAFSKGKGKIIDSLNSSVKQIVGKGYNTSNDNIAILRNILIEKEIEIVINQWGLPLVPIKVINNARKGLHVKVISVFHNDPLQNGRIQSVKTEIEKKVSFLHRVFLYIKLFVYRCITGCAMRYIYHNSDYFEVLSPSFVAHFKRFTCIRNPKKLVVQTNPVTLRSEGFVYDEKVKKKEIVYVGRLDYTQKRVSRIIDTWSILEKSYPEWNLTIIGDGEERRNLELMVKENNLNRVFFEGFQSPREYYERASILILTSEFEGFPLVIAEGMSFGVVPVVYGSYPAVYDIIEDGTDGIILSKSQTGFNANLMAQKVELLIKNPKELEMMAHAAIEKSRNYSVEKIYQQWMGVLSDSVPAN